MSQRTRTGICRLCLQLKELQDSHLLPRGIYKVLRATHAGNPNPLVVTRESSRSTSKQLQDYLLCGDCEQRFNKMGETWMLLHCYRQSGSFRLRELLYAATPVLQNHGDLVYAAASIPGISRDKLVYFGASVFWRAAVHEWRMPTTSINIKTNLSSYEDKLRRFLLGELPFPQQMVMAVRVSGLTSLLETAMVPDQQVDAGFDIHQFMIPGVEFALLVGSSIPAEFRPLCTASSPEGYVVVSRELDTQVVQHLVGLGGMYTRSSRG